MAQRKKPTELTVEREATFESLLKAGMDTYEKLRKSGAYAHMDDSADGDEKRQRTADGILLEALFLLKHAPSRESSSDEDWAEWTRDRDELQARYKAYVRAYVQRKE